MIASISGRLPRMIFAGVALLSFLMLTGCGEAITFANKSYAKGQVFLKDKAWGDAAGAFRNAIRQDPRHYESHYYLAVCYDHLDQHQQAFSEYKTALDVQGSTLGGKNDPEFRQTILQGYAESVAKFDSGDVELNGIEARAKTEQKGEDYFLLAKIYRNRSDADSALLNYRKACNYDVNDFVIRKEAGLYLLNDLNQPKEAEYFLRYAYELNTNDDQVKDGLRKLGVLPPAVYLKEQDVVKAPPAPKASGTGTSKTVAVPRD